MVILESKLLKVSVIEEVKPQQMDLVSKDKVHYFFNTNTETTFYFSEHYFKKCAINSYFIIYNSQKDIPLDLHCNGSKILSVEIETDYFHTLIADLANEYSDFKFKGFGIQHYSINATPAKAEMLIDSLLNNGTPTALKSTFVHAKIIELFSYCYDLQDDSMYTACPFLKDKKNIGIIQEAKDILIQHLDEHIPLRDLAKKVGINEFNLKLGFKSIYGKPIYSFIKEYKLKYSQKLLADGLKVNEVAEKVGYSNATHYIKAFKAVYDTTPKKFIDRQRFGL
jgi:AraC family transcriptional regulator, transcriptional activator of the genes for pyochelin and ferripyochelin receptors